MIKENPFNNRWLDIVAPFTLPPSIVAHSFQHPTQYSSRSINPQTLLLQHHPSTVLRLLPWLNVVK